MLNEIIRIIQDKLNMSFDFVQFD